MARITDLHAVLTTAWLAALLATAACTGAPPASPAAAGARAEVRADGPGAVFPSVQAAALDALANAHLTATPHEKLRLRVGAIHRVDHGYSYTAPRRAAATSPLMHQSVRHRLSPIDVASYVIPPRSGTWPAPRADEIPVRKAQRIVDELDPAHRPIYLLTESLDVVSYRYGEQTRVVTNLSAPR